jgi:hypothetical protein
LIFGLGFFPALLIYTFWKSAENIRGAMPDSSEYIRVTKQGIDKSKKK